jgi:predicted unusual protein kinase regulating ubiquinone biosynthesis (AarF/ABC1/UbiB family)
MFKNNSGVYVPVIYHTQSSDRVLTMEDVTSIKISDYAALEAAGISRKAVADRLIDTYLTQVFTEHFFHADPHPGNLFVYPLPTKDETADFGADGRPFYLIFVDFGMTGRLTEKISAGLINTLAALLSRDPHKLVVSYAELGFILPGADLERIEEAAKIAFDSVWGMSMTEMRDMDYASVQAISNQFNELLYDMPFYVPQDFIYLGRTVGILSGMGTSLDPNFNPWKELQRYWGGLARGQAGANGGLSLENLVASQGTQALVSLGQSLVRRAVNPTGEVLERIERGSLTFQVEQSHQMQRQMARIETQTRRTTRAMLAGSVLISSTLLYTNGDIVLAGIGFALSALWFIGIFLGNESR